MPSLPFTFNDVNSRLSDLSKGIDTRAEGTAPDTSETVNNAQAFLSEKVDQIKEQFGTTDGLIDTGLAMNPVTRYIDMGSKFFGGKGLAEGFKEGVTHETGTSREIRVPPMPF
jgi:hypothetical protein